MQLAGCRAGGNIGAEFLWFSNACLTRHTPPEVIERLGADIAPGARSETSPITMVAIITPRPEEVKSTFFSGHGAQLLVVGQVVGQDGIFLPPRPPNPGGSSMVSLLDTLITLNSLTPQILYR
jgi:hypothetical protein